LNRWLQQSIKDFCNKSEHNILGDVGNEKAWEEPIIGFSRGDDPLYDTLKEDIGAFYWTPLEIYRKTFPKEKEATCDELAIISWILPHTEKTKQDQRKQTKYPSERWVRARIFGEQFNDKLRRFVVDILSQRGYHAIAPVLSPLWATRVSDPYGLAANWSERHTAFVSGLGTFGLCDGLITPVGKAIRSGSVVADVSIEPTPRPYRAFHDYCLFYTKGTCRNCVDRCPAGAITEKGHDKEKCNNYIRSVVTPHNKEQYHLGSGGCGLCQVLVPCASKIPSEHDVGSTRII